MRGPGDHLRTGEGHSRAAEDVHRQAPVQLVLHVALGAHRQPLSAVGVLDAVHHTTATNLANMPADILPSFVGRVHTWSLVSRSGASGNRPSVRKMADVPKRGRGFLLALCTVAATSVHPAARWSGLEYAW